MRDAVGRGDDAIKAWQEAVRIKPDLANEQYWLGKALLDRKRYAEALPALQAGRGLYPDGTRGVEIRERLLEALSALGQDSEAEPVRQELAAVQAKAQGQQPAGK